MSLRRCLIVLNLAIAIALSGVFALSVAQNVEADCLSCHGKVYEKGISKAHQHSPFKKRECGACHLKQRGTVRGKDAVKTGPGEVKNRCTGLNFGEKLTIDACYQCHPPDVLGLSHPVGVAAGGTTKIPDYLPALAGSVITCVTCHNVHGGNAKHFVRRRATSCNVCHGD